MTSTGELRMRIFILLGSNENSLGEKAILLGSSEDSMAKSLFLFGKKFRSLGCLPLYWGIIRGWGETKVDCYLVAFQTLRRLAGEFGETGWSPLGIDNWRFDSARD